jgi:hypothetical protein
MNFKRIAAVITVITMALFITSAAFAEDTESGFQFQTLEKLETIIYGETQGGGLLTRLNNIETEVFGRSLPGSLTERQTAMLNFVEKGSGSQPSLIFKMGVAEWGIAGETYPEKSAVKRVEDMESILEGSVQNGALAARVERLITRLLPDGVTAVSVEVPAGSIIKAALTRDLTVRTVKVGDEIYLKLTEQFVFKDNLVAPKGSRVFAVIRKVKPPRSFGRGSEIGITFKSLEAIGSDTIPVILGDSAQKAMNADGATVGAIGASVAGAALLGPLGLAGGLFIRGSDNQIKAGTAFYVETEENATVTAYKVPGELSSMIESGDKVPDL